MFRDERGGNCNILVVDDGEEKELTKEELRIFESKFPLKDKVAKLKNDSSHTSNGADDLRFEREHSAYLKLYRYDSIYIFNLK